MVCLKGTLQIKAGLPCFLETKSFLLPTLSNKIYFSLFLLHCHALYHFTCYLRQVESEDYFFFIFFFTSEHCIVRPQSLNNTCFEYVQHLNYRAHELLLKLLNPMETVRMNLVFHTVTLHLGFVFVRQIMTQYKMSCGVINLRLYLPTFKT